MAKGSVLENILEVPMKLTGTLPLHAPHQISYTLDEKRKERMVGCFFTGKSSIAEIFLCLSSMPLGHERFLNRNNIKKIQGMKSQVQQSGRSQSAQSQKKMDFCPRNSRRFWVACENR